MHDPFQTLGLPPNATDEAVRARFLELTKRHSPEKEPQRFAQIREAYECLRDLDTRLSYRLFEAGQNDSIENIIEDVSCPSHRRRLKLSELMQAAKPD